MGHRSLTINCLHIFRLPNFLPCKGFPVKRSKGVYGVPLISEPSFEGVWETQQERSYEHSKFGTRFGVVLLEFSRVKARL